MRCSGHGHQVPVAEQRQFMPGPGAVGIGRDGEELRIGGVSRPRVSVSPPRCAGAHGRAAYSAQNGSCGRACAKQARPVVGAWFSSGVLKELWRLVHRDGCGSW